MEYKWCSLQHAARRGLLEQDKHTRLSATRVVQVSGPSLYTILSLVLLLFFLRRKIHVLNQTIVFRHDAPPPSFLRYTLPSLLPGVRCGPVQQYPTDPNVGWPVNEWFFFIDRSFRVLKCCVTLDYNVLLISDSILVFNKFSISLLYFCYM